MASKVKSTNGENLSLKNIGDSVLSLTSDFLENSDFISRTIGMTNSYEDIMFLVQLLGYEPVSLLGKNYSFIYDHVRRNVLNGTENPSILYGSNGVKTSCPRFSFYKETPTIRFADPYNDSMNLLNRWVSDFTLGYTSVSDGGDYITTVHYAESSDGKTENKSINYHTDNGASLGAVYSFPQDMPTCDIIKKTNDDFNHGKYNTLVARFHTSEQSSYDSTQTAISNKFGMSHGRNLLKKNGFNDKTNGYNNPYCRVWTYHHQYNQMARAIRPFSGYTADGLERAEKTGDTVGFRTLSTNDFGGGSKRLDDYGVLNYKNNMVNIAPTAKIINYFESKEDSQTFSTKKCMFSIENLAWKDVKSITNEYDENGLSPEQRGPLGGRIMWFPPYDLQFSEDVKAEWNRNRFIGRGEDVLTYVNTERSGNLSFTLLIDHPSILDYWTDRDKGDGNSGGVDNTSNQENTLLRFFAGCEVLTAKPQEYDEKITKPLPLAEKAPSFVMNDKVPDTVVAQPTTEEMYCFLYFPNNYSGIDDTPEFAIDYLMFGKGTQEVNVIEGNELKRKKIDPVLENGWGYEVSTSGISQITYSNIANVYKPGLIEGYEAEYEKICSGYIGSEFYEFAKLIGSGAKKTKDTKTKTSPWRLQRWYYRVDDSTKNENLTRGGAPNYIDERSYQMNSTGYEWVKNVKPFGLEEKKLVGFTDLYVALNGNASSLPHNKENKDRIKSIFNQEDGYKVISLEFRGYNSAPGSTSSNASLSTNRGETFKKWMINKKFPKAEEAIVKESFGETESYAATHKSNDINDQYSKAWRSACVIIRYEKSDNNTAASVEPINANHSNGEVQVVKTEIDNKKTSKTNEYEKFRFSVDMKDAEEEGISTDRALKSNTVKRYDNEGMFFESLSENVPFLHHLICKKIKYFDPAFHSVSPEGFNARLTFLHQCTRQGSTVENNAADSSTAYNLAFGRPPVCVLRIGDFYYTKIVIDSLSIQYENPQWDLNPEGIGVMPMFAKISIRFTFLGGSDLGGPIARLQNAVSFNYYANTSVYDNRAEMVEYDNNKKGNEVKFKGWNYPSDLNKKG